MRSISILALVLACTACASQPNPVVPPTDDGAGTAATTAQPPANQPPCTSYTVPVTVGGQQQQSVVESCQQPDGSWRITQRHAGIAAAGLCHSSTDRISLCLSLSGLLQLSFLLFL